MAIPSIPAATLLEGMALFHNVTLHYLFLRHFYANNEDDELEVREAFESFCRTHDINIASLITTYISVMQCLAVDDSDPNVTTFTINIPNEGAE